MKCVNSVKTKINHSTRIAVEPFLDLDLQNPRLGSPVSDQIEALRTMATAQGKRKFLAIVQHIHDHGLNPADSFIVTRENRDTYTVLDGNRRLTAIKALESPAIFRNSIPKTASSKLERLHRTYITTPISEVVCTVFETRKAADTWIRLAHDGESKGAGRVRWSSQQRHRYNLSRSSSRTNPTTLQVLRFVYDSGAMDVNTSEKYNNGAFPLSILERLLSSPEVCTLLGIEKRNNEVLGRYPVHELTKGLGTVVNSIGSKEIQTKHVHTREQRVEYIHSLPDSARPDEDTKLDKAIPLSDILGSESRSKRAANDREGGNYAKEFNEGVSQDGAHRSTHYAMHSNTRNRLIPPSTSLEIPVARIKDIMVELKKLRLDTTPNAIAVLFRTFLELSVDAYIESHPIPEVTDESLLKKKLEAVSTFLEDNKIMSRNELLPLRRAISTDTDLNSVRTLHSFVHNRFHSPGGRDLCAMWDSFDLFFKKIWEAAPQPYGG